jgi:hypothetical protein
VSERSDTDEIDVADLCRTAAEAARLVREQEQRAEAEEWVTSLLGRHDPRTRPQGGPGPARDPDRPS